MPRGYAQLPYLEKRFADIPIHAVYSSDLTRACLTARSIYIPKGLKLHRDPRFRELNVGVWEDLAYGYLDNFQSEKMWQFSHDPKNWAVKGSESYDTYTSRFITGMEEAALENDGRIIAIFSHGAVLRGTLMRLFFNDQPDKLPLSDNTGVCHLFYENGHFSYDYLNDNSHMPEELSTFYLQSWWRKNDNRKEANLYFVPYRISQNEDVPKDFLALGGKLMAAMLSDCVIGAVSLGNVQGECGVIQGMWMDNAMLERGYTDQLLGCAISHFRRVGCRSIRLLPGEYPEQLERRYDFDPHTRERSIDSEVFTF